MNNLLDRIRSRANNEQTIHDMAVVLNPKPTIHSVASTEEIAQLEMELGFTFPALLVKIYTEIGNGGFGPGYGLYDLQTAKNIYLDCMSDPENEWEQGTWPLCTWGCDIESYVDCIDKGFPIYYTNENFGHEEEDHSGDLNFTLTDKDGNVVSSGKSNNLHDLLNNLSADESDEESDEDDGDVGLLFHKDTIDEWFEDWVNGISLWDQMSNEEEDDEDSDDDNNDDIEMPQRGEIPRRPGSL